MVQLFHSVIAPVQAIPGDGKQLRNRCKSLFTHKHNKGEGKSG